MSLAPSALPRVDASRQLIEKILEKEVAVYGVNTGFGKLSDVRIPGNHLSELQINLLRSHACGLGRPLSEAEVRAMLLLRANVLAKGFSGVRRAVIEMLTSLLNRGIHPVSASFVRRTFGLPAAHRAFSGESRPDLMKSWS